MLDSGKDRPLRLIGVASGLGAPAWAQEACAQGPEILQQMELDAAAKRNGCECSWDAMLAQTVLPDLLATLAERVGDCIAQGEFPVVIGGDHSIGAARALEHAPHQDFGLLWINAHTPATSPTGNLHGMPPAALLGINIAGLSDATSPRIDPGKLCVVDPKNAPGVNTPCSYSIADALLEIEREMPRTA